MKNSWEWWQRASSGDAKAKSHPPPIPASSLSVSRESIARCCRAILVGVAICGIGLGLLVLNELWNSRYVAAASSNFDKGHYLFQCLNSYTADHDGQYPKGNSSTEIFQVLLDEHYVDNASRFYVQMKGKWRSEAGKLKPENVCWDVTWCGGKTLPEHTPSVFLTGFRIEDSPEGRAFPRQKLELFTTWHDVYLPALFQGDNGSSFPHAAPDGCIHRFISNDFDPKGRTFLQLTPEGPLKP